MNDKDRIDSLLNVLFSDVYIPLIVGCSSARDRQNTLDESGNFSTYILENISLMVSNSYITINHQ